jgi:hypothetical protein
VSDECRLRLGADIPHALDYHVSDHDFSGKRPTTRLVQRRGPPVRDIYGGLARLELKLFTSADSAMRYFPLLAGVVDVAMTCQVLPLRDHTCRL